MEGHGFAALVQRGGSNWFVAKGSEWPASAEEAETARQLFTQLKAILESEKAAESS
jgi:hypothetical protein